MIKIDQKMKKNLMSSSVENLHICNESPQNLLRSLKQSLLKRNSSSVISGDQNQQSKLKRNGSQEKQLGQLQENLQNALNQISNQKIENSKIKKIIEKSENQNKQSNTVLQKMNAELKFKDEQLNKNQQYITKLEQQLLKGNINVGLLENIKKLENQIELLENERDELKLNYTKQNQQVQDQLNRIDILQNAMEIKLIDFNIQNKSNKIQSQDLLNKVELELKIKQAQMENIQLKQEMVLLNEQGDEIRNQLEINDIKIHNLECENESYKEALQQINEETREEIQQLQDQNDFLQDQLKKKTSEITEYHILLENQTSLQIFEQQMNDQKIQLEKQKNLIDNANDQYKKLKEQHQDEIQQIKNLEYQKQQQILKEQAILNQKLQQKIQNLEDTNQRYIKMILLSENLFNDDFEGILRESLSIIKERKVLRNEIHRIVEDCANQIVGFESAR